MIVKMLVHKHGCTSGVPLWVRHGEDLALTERIVNCLPVMHLMATMLRKCIQLQRDLARLDQGFTSSETIRDKIVALCGRVGILSFHYSSRSLINSK